MAAAGFILREIISVGRLGGMDHTANSAGTNAILYSKHCHTHTQACTQARAHTHTHTWCGVKYGNWGSASDQHGFVVEAVGSRVPVTHPGLSTGGSFSLLIISVPSYRLVYLYPCLWNYPLFTTVCKPLLSCNVLFWWWISSMSDLLFDDWCTY